MADAHLFVVEREIRARLIVRRWPFIASGLSVAVGTFILSGWLLGHQRWTTFVPHLPMTAANSALMAVLAATSLALLASRDPAKRLVWLGRACAAAVVVVMGLTLLEFLFNVNLWVDRLMPIAPRLIVRHHPGRPSPQSSIGFMLLGLALLALDRRDRAGRPLSDALALPAALLALLALLGYVFGAAQLYRPFTLFWYIGMGLGTASTMFFVSTGILAARAEHGMFGVLLRDDAGGYAARQLLTWLVLFAIGTGAIAFGARQRAFDAALGSALIVCLETVGGTAFVIRMARNLSDVDARLRFEMGRATGIFSISADAIISVDVNQRITSFNAAAERAFGYSKDEVLGSQLERLIPARLRDVHRGHVKQFAAGSEIARHIGHEGMEILGLRKDGKEFHADATISKLEVDNITVFTVALRDVTEQRRREAEKTILAQVGAIFTASLDYEQNLTTVAQMSVQKFADLCVVDLVDDGRVRRLTAVSRDEAHAWVCDVLENIPRDAGDVSVGQVATSRKTQLLEYVRPNVVAPFAPQDVQRRMQVALGAVSIIAIPLAAHAKVLGAVALIRTSSRKPFDLSDVFLAEEVADRAALAIENGTLYRTAQRAIRDRDDVMGVVAHDLRNPLGTILLQTELLASVGEAQAEDGNGPAGVIQRAASRMNRLIQDLLDVTRLEAKRLKLAHDTIPAAALVGDAVEGHKSMAAAAGLELRVELSRALPGIAGDRDRLLQVFENLIGNALKFTAKGGRVSVSAKVADGDVLFAVADSGSGVAAEDVPHLFERFWQARSAKRGGAGLGLTIAKGIVEAHGGRIWATSAVHKGTTFYFTIPVVRPQEAQGAPERRAS